MFNAPRPGPDLGRQVLDFLFAALVAGVGLFARRDDIAHPALGPGIGVAVVEPVVNGESIEHNLRTSQQKIP